MLITGTRLCKLGVTAKVDLVDPWIRDHVRVMVTQAQMRTSALDVNKTQFCTTSHFMIDIIRHST